MVPDRRAASTVLADGIDRLLRESVHGSAAAKVLDLGGGTGGLAVRLATRGHHITVVDPSPDALATLSRRAADAGVAGHVHAVQGDAEGLRDLVDDGTVDLVLCHGVLEVVDDPAVALHAIRSVLRGSGRLSLVVAQRHAAVLFRASAGHLRQALRLATDPDGRWGHDDPLLRRFDRRDVCRLLDEAGFAVLDTQGVRVFSDLVPRGSVDSDPAVAGVLAELETYASDNTSFLDIAAQLHVQAAPS